MLLKFLKNKKYGDATPIRYFQLEFFNLFTFSLQDLQKKGGA